MKQLLLLVVSVAAIAAAGDLSAATIKTLNSGHCLAMDGGIDKPESSGLMIKTCDGGAGQQFALSGDGTVRQGERCVEIKDGQGNAGDQVVMTPCHGGASQKWEYLGYGSVRGLNFLCLDVKGGGGDNTEVIVWRCHGGKNQRWSIE